MPVHDELGIRMKDYYEQIPKTKLMRRTPVIIRIDGRAFHSFTKGFCKPFDEVLIKSMQHTMKYLCENIQGCVLGYHQSDEISLVLVDYKRLNSDAWFDYEVQKICSIAASMATMAFNKIFPNEVISTIPNNLYENKELLKLFSSYSESITKGAMFDARCFNIPKEEVTNYIYWRQLDASRNSIQMVGQAHFSHKKMHCKSCNQIQDMLMQEKNINWNDFPVYQKRGSCCIKEKYFLPCENGKGIKYTDGYVDPYNDNLEYGIWRTHWIIDNNIPIFIGEGRNYVERLIHIEE